MRGCLDNSSGNCPRGKLLFGWFVAYIIPPMKTVPRNIVSRINYTRYIFSPKIRNHSTLVDSCFLLFSFFVIKVSNRLWFLLKKKLYKNSETETIEKRRTSQEEIEYRILKQNCVCFCNRKRLTRFTIKKLIKFCSSKGKSSVYLNFSRLAIFSIKFYTTI